MKREPIYRKALLAIIAALCFILPNANAQNMDKGLHLIDMDQFHNAIVVFKDITKQAPTNAEAWYYLGICYSEIENADSALSAFNAGLAADPKNPVNVSGQAIVQHLKKNDAQAKATFMNAYKFSQKKYPNGLVSIIKGYAICKYPIDEFIDAVYKKALANNIKDPNIYLNWGEILYNNKDYGNASLSYQRALSYDENNVLAHYLLGQMYNAARNTPAALADLDAALELNPQFVPAIREKGEAYYVMNKFDDAAIWYAKYIDLTEETVSSLTKYAEVLFLAKKYEKAHEIISKVVKLDPNN
ncbi:MAG: tetratricopeptide repeat protein, partial [Bacteroidota bacterium]|nr:tetratricopeptide repeat protein [Bacteroidota bacterium]